MKTNEIEQLLRQSQEALREPAPSRLRHRIVNRLSESERLGSVSPSRHNRWATLAGALAVAAVAIIAFAIAMPPRSQQSASIAPVAQHNTAFQMPVLPRLSARPVGDALARPLQNEVNRLARDAERFVDHWHKEASALPRILASIQDRETLNAQDLGGATR